jgi:mannobiose 2-epimerase
MSTSYLVSLRDEVSRQLENELVPFWLSRSIDPVHGGYLTALDAAGHLVPGETDKYIVMQTRMLWSFSRFCRFYAQSKKPAEALQEAARQGFDFLIAHMWDAEYGGWYWRCAQNGETIVPDKVMYGQSFAIYALSEYSYATGDPRGLEYADRTFNTIQRYGADVARGGYYESFARDWGLKVGEHFSGDRKSMNTQMHLMEAFTTLALASGQMVHARRLQELIDLITKRLINPVTGAGHEWFSLDFIPQPLDELVVNWNGGGDRQLLDPPVFLNSYGHDIELAWLLVEAGNVLGQPHDTYLPVARGLVDHALAYGLDRTYGGIYYEGQQGCPALFRYKGWWQQAEALVGFLDLYDLTHEETYLDVFRLTWSFVNQHMINHAVGEWRTMIAEDGQELQGDLGHAWKAAYHTGRALIEIVRRIDRILAV